MDGLTGGDIGTTKQGIGPTYATKADRIGIRMGDLLKPDWSQRVIQFYDKYGAQLKHRENSIIIRNSCDTTIQLNSLDDMLQYDLNLISKYINQLRPRIINTVSFIEQNYNKSFLIEGANATLLDIDHGTYPYVTSSSCGAGGVLSGSGLSMKVLRDWYAETIGVFKIYVTRVGGGVLPTEMVEMDSEIGINVQTLGNEYGATTGRKRRCGWLDLVALKYSCMLNGYDYLNIAKVDILSFVPNLKTIKICTQYRNRETNEITDIFPSDEYELCRMEPIYSEFPIWDNPTQCKTWKDLPLALRTVIKFIEGYVGIPIKYINTGQDRNALIVRD